MESAYEQQGTFACAQVFVTYELLHLVVDYVDNAKDLLQLQKVCRLFNTHVHDLKHHMSRAHAKIKKVPDSALRFSIFTNTILEHLPKRFCVKDSKDNQHRSVHFFQSMRLPKDVDIEPWNMFITQPPVTKATLLIFHRDRYLIPRRTPARLWRHITVELEQQEGITFGCVMKNVGREVLGSAAPYMVVLGERVDKLNGARIGFERVVSKYGKMTYGGM